MGRPERSADPHEAQPARNVPGRTVPDVSPDVTVGVIANPASGRDIRRLVAGASVFGNADKAGMVFRLLAGLGAAGVARVLMLPAPDGLSTTLHRHLDGRRTAPGFDGAAPFPALEELALALDGTARDSVVAVQRMLEAGVTAIVVLGGDGTHRVVAKACGDVPLCALSTGTNNAFPEMREATVAGLATGLVATGRAGDGTLRREAALAVRTPDGEPDLALVDVAVTRERFIGARALWRPEDVTEIFVTFASPSAVGLSAVAGALQPLDRGGGQGLHVRLAPDAAAARRTVKVALAPGLIVDVPVAGHRVLALGEEVEVAAGAGTVALDGEREIERRHGDPVTVRLVPGPLTIDVDAVMRAAAGAAMPVAAPLE
jgi:predicted polyphosphate/ATP-dependent NAD kinase